MRQIISYGKHQITDEDIESVVEVLNSDFLTQERKIKEAKLNFSNYIDSKYSVAVSNGTAALHVSLLSLGLKKGDRLEKNI